MCPSLVPFFLMFSATPGLWYLSKGWLHCQREKVPELVIFSLLKSFRAYSAFGLRTLPLFPLLLLSSLDERRDKCVKESPLFALSHISHSHNPQTTYRKLQSQRSWTLLCARDLAPWRHGSYQLFALFLVAVFALWFLCFGTS